MLLEKDRMFLEKALTSCVSVQALEAVVVVAMLQICISSEDEAQAICMRFLEGHCIAKHCRAQGLSLIRCEFAKL